MTVNTNQMGGVPCIRGLRIPVATVVGMVADGLKQYASGNCPQGFRLAYRHRSPLPHRQRRDGTEKKDSHAAAGLCHNESALEKERK